MRSTLLVALSLILTACASASGPKFSAVYRDVPVLEKGKGRVYFFRPSNMPKVVYPDYFLNDQLAGTAFPLSMTFVDMPAGHYKIRFESTRHDVAEMDVVAGEDKYVRLNWKVVGMMDEHMEPEVIPERDGDEIVGRLTYISSPLMKGRLPASLGEKK
jgi:hypothetical protein